MCLPGFEDLIPSSTYCFTLNLSELKTWNDAENSCRNVSQYHGGHLLSIGSSQVNSAIANHVLNGSHENMTTEIWIGLRNVDYEKGSMLIKILLNNV